MSVPSTSGGKMDFIKIPLRCGDAFLQCCDQRLNKSRLCMYKKNCVKKMNETHSLKSFVLCCNILQWTEL